MENTPTTESGIQTFAQDVIEASREQLVMVDFWADWCGPCKSLTPILENLAAQSQGAVKLVKVNADQEQELAAQFGIRSLPTVFFFKNAEIVDQFMGAQPESAIRAIIERHLGDQGPNELEAAAMAYEAGNQEQAKAFVLQLISQDPGNDSPKLLLLKWLVAEGNLDDAARLSDTLSEEGKASAEYKAYQSALDLQQATEGLPDSDSLAQAIEQDPGNLEARYQLAQKLVAEQDYEAGLEHLLEIVSRSREFEEDGARLMMIKVFESLGGSGKLVSQYRSRLARLLN